MKLPLVSIGVPVYNGEKYLEECLVSILGQTYENWECVISNNASTDRTTEIAEEFVRKDKRFRLFHTGRLFSITDNWNFVFSNTNPNAAYFKILPADDWLFPDYLSEMIQVMERYPEAGQCCSYHLSDREIGSAGLDYYEGNLFKGEVLLISQLRGEMDITSSVTPVLYRTSTLKRSTFFPEIYQDVSFHIDTYLSFQILKNSDLAFVFKVLSYIRRHEASVTSTVTNVRQTRIYFWELVLFQFRSLDPALEIEYRKVRIRYAYFILKNTLLFRRSVLQWHQERLQRSITFLEYLQAIMRRIFFNRF
jgi:glycosyltransferase involved in cell wall biosynthesis